MEQRALGRSGLKVSAVGLGCNNFGMRIDAAQTQAVVDAAIDLGITLFDTADVYGGKGQSEEFLGKALGARRGQVIIATKFGIALEEGVLNGGGSRRYIMSAVEDSLRRLNTDWIDVYQMHRPDPETPIDETLRALDDLVTSGKVRYIGVSNYAAWQMSDAYHRACALNGAPVVSTQNRYSLLSRQIELDVISVAEKYGMGLLPYFPLESGLLTGKYKAGEPPRKAHAGASGKHAHPKWPISFGQIRSSSRQVK